MTYLTRARATLAFIALVLVMGGASAAGFTANLTLQVLGAGLIVWSLHDMGQGQVLRTGLGWFFLTFAVLIAVQFVPLPPGLWRHLPGRDAVYQGFVTMGSNPPWLMVSLAPWNTLSSLTWWIPALAVFLSVKAPQAPSNRELVWTVTGVALVAVILGVLQTLADKPYIYTITNTGVGTGFFANANHQGALQLGVLALWSGWAIARSRSMATKHASLANNRTVHASIALLLAAGVVISGSQAIQALLVPVLIGLALAVRPTIRINPALFASLALLLVGAAVAAIAMGSFGNDLGNKGAVAGISRQEFLLTGLKALADFAPLGSGIGTFVDLYRWYEDPTIVSTTFVNHAHDDLLEILIETGIFGLAAVLAFLAWFVPRAWRLWLGDRQGALQLGASLVVAAVLAHSLVDYPLRTAAVSTIFALACVLMVRPADAERSPRASARPVRGKAQGPMRI